MGLVYIDRNGNYGNAEGAVVFDIRELSEEHRKVINEALDRGDSLWSAIAEVNSNEVIIGAKLVEVDDKSAVLYSKKNMDNLVSQRVFKEELDELF
jgi:hypothetical protein